MLNLTAVRQSLLIHSSFIFALFSGGRIIERDIDFKFGMILGRDDMDERRLLDIEADKGDIEPTVLLFSATKFICPLDPTNTWWLVTPHSNENLMAVRRALNIPLDQTRHLAFVLTPASIDEEISILEWDGIDLGDDKQRDSSVAGSTTPSVEELILRNRALASQRSSLNPKLVTNYHPSSLSSSIESASPRLLTSVPGGRPPVPVYSDIGHTSHERPARANVRDESQARAAMREDRQSMASGTSRASEPLLDLPDLSDVRSVVSGTSRAESHVYRDTDGNEPVYAGGPRSTILSNFSKSLNMRRLMIPARWDFVLGPDYVFDPGSVMASIVSVANSSELAVEAHLRSMRDIRDRYESEESLSKLVVCRDKKLFRDFLLAEYAGTYYYLGLSLWHFLPDRDYEVLVKRCNQKDFRLNFREWLPKATFKKMISNFCNLYRCVFGVETLHFERAILDRFCSRSDVGDFPEIWRAAVEEALKSFSTFLKFHRDLSVMRDDGTRGSPPPESMLQALQDRIFGVVEAYIAKSVFESVSTVTDALRSKVRYVGEAGD